MHGIDCKCRLDKNVSVYFCNNLFLQLGTADSSQTVSIRNYSQSDGEICKRNILDCIFS